MARTSTSTDAAAAKRVSTRARRAAASAAAASDAVDAGAAPASPSSPAAAAGQKAAAEPPPPRLPKKDKRAKQQPPDDDDDEEEDVKVEASAPPPTLRVRIASPPVTVTVTTRRVDVADAPMDDDDDELDAAARAVEAAALRIDAATGAAAAFSPTSVASAPTSPADDSGLNTPNTPNGSEAAAHKRRRLEDPPMFLEKTYEMLEKCAPEIACWSPDAGESFIVKKPIEFAEHVIPVYFKHKNFSSFVRQLNFYGFRKVRVDAETAAAVDPKEWWEFRHDKFVRGRRDLLREIKRRTIADGRSTIERAEMDELRAEVLGLKEQMQQLNKHMMSVMQALVARNNNNNSSSSSSSNTNNPPASAAATSSTSTTTTNNNNTSSSSSASPSHQLAPTYDYQPHQHQQTQHQQQQQFYPHQQHHPSTPGSTPSMAHPPLPSLQQQQQHHHALLQLHQGVPQSAKTTVVASRTSVHSGRMSNGGGQPQQQQLQQQHQHLQHQHQHQQPPYFEGSKRTPVATYQLRPLQSVVPVVHHLPPGATTTSTTAASHHASPVFSYRSGPGSAPAGMSFVERVDWSAYARHAQPSFEPPPPRFASPISRGTPVGADRSGLSLPLSSSSSSSSHRRADAPSHIVGFKRGHDSASRAHETPPDAAVRQLSMTAMQTRSELLGCIIARVLGFIRVQHQHQQPRSGEVDAVADAVVSDIQQLLARVQEPPSSPAGAPIANSEAACMYRVEILKYISRELPRAVSDSVEKRIPAPAKKTLNRSLLALLVQKAQAALEHQMRIETTASPPLHSSSGEHR